jgi:hypothetical protein
MNIMGKTTFSGRSIMLYALKHDPKPQHGSNIQHSADFPQIRSWPLSPASILELSIVIGEKPLKACLTP